MVVGHNTDIGSMWNSGSNALGVGQNCSVKADASVALGNNTHVEKNHSLGVGHGIVVPDDGDPGTVIVGRYNDTAEYGTNDVVFGVGDGTSGTPDNAMTIYADGLIEIKPQGSLSMQGFDN